MLFANVGIAGVVHVDAPVRVTSEELERQIEPTLNRLGQKPGLIESLTGVVARRFFGRDQRPSTVATKAAHAVLERTGIAPSDIGVVINTSVCKDYIEPSIASTVHANLGLGADCLNFDIGNACLAFLDGMQVASNMLERGQIEYALIVDGEDSRFAVESTIARLAADATSAQDLRDDFATLTLGSGAAAMILCRGDRNDGSHRFVGGVQRAATQHNTLCQGQPDRMTTDAGALLAAGVELAEQTWAQAESHLGWTPDDLDVIVMHQVGAGHFKTLIKRLGLRRDRAFLTYPEFGNIGPAAIPITLSKAVEAGRVHAGDRVALMGIGSGLNCAMMEVRW